MSNAERLVGTDVDALLDCARNGEDAINSPRQKTTERIGAFCLQIFARKIFMRSPNPGCFRRNRFARWTKTLLGQLAFLWSSLPKADDTYRCIGRVYCCFKIGCVALGDRDGFPRTLEKRSASLYFSTKRVTKATTVRASTNSTSHITIVGLNIVDPFRTLMPTPDFLNSYLRHRCPLLDTCVTSVLFRLSPIQPTKGLACRSMRYSVRQMNTFDWTCINPSNLISFLLVAWQRTAGRMTVVL